MHLAINLDSKPKLIVSSLLIISHIIKYLNISHILSLTWLPLSVWPYGFPKHVGSIKRETNPSFTRTLPKNPSWTGILMIQPLNHISLIYKSWAVSSNTSWLPKCRKSQVVWLNPSIHSYRAINSFHHPLSHPGLSMDLCQLNT